MPLYRDNAENLRDKAKYTETVWEHNSVQHALHALSESFKVVYLYNVCYIKHILSKSETQKICPTYTIHLSLLHNN